MQINLHHKIEHWRESPEWRDIVDEVESEIGFSTTDEFAYDDLIPEFRDAVEDALESAGHSVSRKTASQSVGIGHVDCGPYGSQQQKNSATNALCIAFEVAAEKIKPRVRVCCLGLQLSCILD